MNTSDLRSAIRRKLRATPGIPKSVSDYMRQNGSKGGRNGTHANKVKAGKAGAAVRWSAHKRARLTETAQKI